MGSAIKIANLEFAANGFGYGLRQEFLKATLHLQLPAKPDWADIDQALVHFIVAHQTARLSIASFTGQRSFSAPADNPYSRRARCWAFMRERLSSLCRHQIMMRPLSL
jgi:hypothetical protein